MKKLAILAGLSGILAVSAMAQMGPQTAAVTVTITGYSALTAGPIAVTVTPMDNSNSYTGSGTSAIEAYSNQAWSLHASTSGLTGPAGSNWTYGSAFSVGSGVATSGTPSVYTLTVSGVALTDVAGIDSIGNVTLTITSP